MSMKYEGQIIPDGYQPTAAELRFWCSETITARTE